MEIDKVVLLIKNPLYFNRYQLMDWYLNHVYQPCTLTQLDNRHFEVLDVEIKGNPKSLLITSNTKIVTVSSSYRLVIVLDQSSSLKTVETKVLSSIAFETICKCLRGMVQPFSITHSITKHITTIKPEIIFSIAIDNDGESIAKRTFLHLQRIDMGNIDDLAEIIYTCMIEYENQHIRDILAKTDDSDLFQASHSENVLDLGLYTLNLLPDHCLPVVVYITDGVSCDFGSMDIHEVQRAFLRNYVHFCVVQVGSALGFTPTSNFGYIPNQEDLRYISQALDGIFVYAEDCEYLDEKASEQPNEYHHMLAFKTNAFTETDKGTFDEKRSVDFVQKKFINTGTESTFGISQKEMNFPWKYDSQPPSIAEILCSYRSYKLPRMELGKLIRIRINEGFSGLKVVKSTTKSSVKVEIILSLLFAPNITVLYTIKFHWQSNPATLMEFIPPKSIRIEINVLAHHPFAVLFINVHNIDSSKSGQIGNSLYEKLGQLHELLKSITESDETLQILGQCNSSSALLLSKQISGEVQSRTETLDLPSNYWQYLNQVLLIKENLLDSWSCNLMLRSTSSQVNLGLRAAQQLLGKQDASRARYQVATIYLSKFLNSWASFNLSKTTYIRWVFGTIEEPVGFCLLQITWETESLMNVNLRFYGCELEEQRRIVTDFHEGVHSIRHTLRNTESMIEPLMICSKPANSLMIGYTACSDVSQEVEDFRKHPDPRNLLFIANASLSRQVLRSQSWIWFADIQCQSQQVLAQLIESSFVLLYNNRNHEGFLRISESPGSISFYKEFTSTNNDVFTVQYILLWNPTYNFLMTEVWIEPIRGSNPKELDYFEKLKKELFEKDLLLLNRLFVLEFAQHEHMFTQMPVITSTNQTISFIETRLFLEPLLEKANLVYSPFKCLCYDAKVHEVLTDTIESSTLIHYTSSNLTADDGLRFDEAQKEGKERHYISEYCHILESDLKEDGSKSTSRILRGFFVAALKTCCDSLVYWNIARQNQTLLDQIQDIVNEDVIALPKLYQSQVFFKHVNARLFMVIVGEVESNDLITTVIIESDCSNIRPEVPSFLDVNNEVCVNISGTVFSNDGSAWIEVLPTSVSVVEPTPLENVRYIFGTPEPAEDIGSSEKDRLQLQIQISRLFYDSAIKTVYYSFLAGLTVLNDDFERSIVRLQSQDIIIDASDLFYIYQLLSHDHSVELKEKILTGFTDIIQGHFCSTNLLLERKPVTNYFYFKAQEESVISLLSLANHPLFLTCFVLDQETLKECGEGIPDDLFQRYKVQDKQFPPSKQNHVIKLVFRLHGIADPHQIPLFSQDQQQVLNGFKSNMETMVQDLILQALLQIKEIKINVPVVQYAESILTSRHEFGTAISDLKKDVSFSGNSARISYQLEFLDSICSTFFWEDLIRFQVGGLPFRSFGKRYSLVNEGDSDFMEPFWILLQLNSDKVLLDFFYSSNDAIQRSEVLKQCSKAIQQCEYRANQRFLLTELADTHMARDEPPHFTDSPYFDKSQKDDILYDYSCAQQYSRFIPIHYRLRPGQVLNSILSALQAITISNRKGILVYSDKFYIKIAAVGEDDEKSTRSESDVLAEKQTKGVEVVVFGLDHAGEDITVDFIKMLNIKIENMIQNVLGTFLARNPRARLSRPDLDFIMPVGQGREPTDHTTYLLVPELENPHLFIVLLRQAFILFLKSLSGTDLYQILGEFYQLHYNQTIPTDREKNPLNELQLGDLSFIYNSVPSRYLSQLESAVGFGIVSVILTPMDRDDNILFPSAASATLCYNQNVVLEENCYKVKSTQDQMEIKNWNGFKIAVSMWSKGSIHLGPLKDRIDSAFQHTLVDYTIESYYRSSKWYSLPSKKRLPDLPDPNHPFEMGEHQPEFVNVLKTLPAILETGSLRKNPVIQSIRINNKLPLDSILAGIRTIFTDEEVQAYFFSSFSDKLSLMDSIPEPNQSYSRNYIVIGASDIYIPPKTNDRRTSVLSDASSTGSLSPRLGAIRLTKNTSLESVSEGSDILERERKDSGSKFGLNFDFEEIFMFPGIFYPPFPIYGKRSSFFLICLFEDHISVSTYNWKKSESDKFFLKVIKILNWAKINDQFISRKESYLGKQFGRTSATEMFSSSVLLSPSPVSFTSKSRDLDFIYHIGGFEAVQLQTQIVDFLELFFRFGKQPIKPSIFSQRESEEYCAPLSLFEMSRVLQSIKLIHSSSSPIFFSTCCNDLVAKWSMLAQSNKMTKSNLLFLAQNISATGSIADPKDETTLESTWFKDMVGQYQEKYIEYLEHLGMEKARYEFTTNEVGMFGGGLFISESEMIEAPSLFLRKFFPNKVIIVQCGFYSYFATVNVLTFDYTSTDEGVSTTDDFERECSNMIHYSHIVSFSYDFHLRYIQDILNRHHHVDLPINLPLVLGNFTTLNPRKARFARNRISKGKMEWKDETADLFRYIMKHPEIYGFKPFFFNGVVVGFGITVEHLHSKASESDNFLYTLVVCEDESESHGCFQLEYFVIMVDKNNTFPHKELENGVDAAKQVDQDPMVEYIASGYYLRDIVAVFEQRIENLVQKALKDFGRDNLWAQLREDSSQTTFEWSGLFLEKIAPNLRDVGLMDPSLNSMFLTDLPWDSIMTYLLQTHLKYARKLKENEHTITDLVLFNPTNQDYLLYLKFTQNSETRFFQMFTVSRSGVRDSVEYDHVNDVINSILYHLWSK